MEIAMATNCRKLKFIYLLSSQFRVDRKLENLNIDWLN